MKAYRDTHSSVISLHATRVTGLLFVFFSTFYTLWVAFHLNTTTLASSAFSIVFLIAVTYVGLHGMLAVINSWYKESNIPEKIAAGMEPRVGVIIPTYNEPLGMVLETVMSVLKQNWPRHKLVIVVSDDGHREDLKREILKLRIGANGAYILYHTPPQKNDVRRNGEAKAGNLNSALEYLFTYFPDVKYIETRDADDLVGDKNFLRYCTSVLEQESNVSFVQTIKRCIVSKGDPFGNQERAFYDRTMSFRSAANALFPCGSGLLWRKTELQKINGFPAWNLVEDLQSGYEILQIGGRGVYIPIVGALGQIAPEDIQNFYKQRGTWAIDTTRLILFHNPFTRKKLNLAQKFQFTELASAYVLSIPIGLLFACLVTVLLFEIYPYESSDMHGVVLPLLVYISYELFSYVRAWGVPFVAQWRAREIWFGLMHVFWIAVFKALWYGPKQKPKYVVTRKFHSVQWYWKETLPQIVMILVLILSIVVYVYSRELKMNIQEAAILMWAGIYILLLSRVVRNGWYGVRLRNLKRFSSRIYVGSARRTT